MPRFFVPELPPEGEVTLCGEDARHVSLSLRMAVGDRVTLCDGHGQEAECALCSFDDGQVRAEILSCGPGKTELPMPVTLYMALPKGDKLETVVQKAVELGAARIVPFESRRCVRQLAPERARKAVERLQKIAREAAMQCGRCRVPEVELPVPFARVLEDASPLRLFCYEGAGTRSLREVLEQTPLPASVCAVVGSEGGFAPEEVQAAEKAGFVPVNLGRRILRCETAPDFVLSALVYRYEL